MDKKTTGNILFWLGAGALVVGAGTYFYQQWLLTDYLCYGLKKFKFKKIGLDNTSIEVILEVENKGDLNIDLKKMTFDIYANGSYVANVNQEVVVSIKPLEKTSIPLTISFNPKKVLGNALTILSATTFNDLAFRFKGKAVVAKWGIPIPVPFDFSYTVAQMKAPSGTSVCEDKK